MSHIATGSPEDWIEFRDFRCFDGKRHTTCFSNQAEERLKRKTSPAISESCLLWQRTLPTSLQDSESLFLQSSDQRLVLDTAIA